ncbi:uncharacterized protein EI97DRAFT_199684 [Westerdykella ornata]|uniref:Uncharacterized protein n=1 Tax=Westerdykella ornata TaxID=318751 RepID=A0A6A6J850_WESOR|nr:uncharacterized protein EI97DRAFT_199684 [Westerdykella ornata]KAF2272741.1 hypothetical protein EI97DRAFT_199684 [Westerdykella ornata]
MAHHDSQMSMCPGRTSYRSSATASCSCEAFHQTPFKAPFLTTRETGPCGGAVSNTLDARPGVEAVSDGDTSTQHKLAPHCRQRPPTGPRISRLHAWPRLKAPEPRRDTLVQTIHPQPPSFLPSPSSPLYLHCASSSLIHPTSYLKLTLQPHSYWFHFTPELQLPQTDVTVIDKEQAPLCPLYQHHHHSFYPTSHPTF